LNNNQFKSKGNTGLLFLAGIVTIVLAGSYFYLDYQVDSRANESMLSLVDEAHAQGVLLSYSSIEASPLNQTVEIVDLTVIGNELEPDVQLGKVVMKGFRWQDLTNEQNKFPLAMSIDIYNGELHLKKSMIDTNPNLQALARILGDTIPFTTNIMYKFNPELNLLNVSLKQAVEDNFSFDGKVLLGNMAWLTTLDQQQAQIPAKTMSAAMNSTLNKFSMTYQNKGIIEKIRADISSQTGQSTEQLTQNSIAQLEQLQLSSAQHWGPVFTPFIDEMIKFSNDPEQLKLDISPLKPLTSQDLLLGFLGGEANLIKLIEDAHLALEAN